MYPIYHHESLDSTNIEAKRLAEEGAIHGTGVIADNQTGGRGRLGKKWHTVGGKGLYCSIIIRPEIGLEDYPKLTLVAGLAVSEALYELCGLRAQLKWPNDIFFQGKKCAGILAESSPLSLEEKERFAVIGIGINVNQALLDFPADLQQTVTTLYRETGKKFDIETVFVSVRQQVLFYIENMEKNGFRPILSEWCKYDYLLGKGMECVDVEGKVIKGVALGPDENGVLRLRTAGGDVVEVLSGDIRLAR